MTDLDRTVAENTRLRQRVADLETTNAHLHRTNTKLHEAGRVLLDEVCTLRAAADQHDAQVRDLTDELVDARLRLARFEHPSRGDGE